MNEKELKEKKIVDLEHSLDYHKRKIEEIKLELNVWKGR